jgi:uncharacterized DUF497 family protein
MEEKTKCYMIDDVVFKGKFIWNRKKNERNKKEHGVSFETGSEVFENLFLVIEYDEEHSIDEDRYNATAYLEGFSYVTVTFTERGSMKRIISARSAEKEEREAFNENIKTIIGAR